MDSKTRNIILKATAANQLFEAGTIQSLWSGYGSIDRYGLIGSELNTMVVKHVHLPEQSKHPRGWNTDNSHQRKLHSYQVETAWIAWTDFYRFLKGWSPGHWKIHSYSERLAHKVISHLQSNIYE